VTSGRGGSALTEPQRRFFDTFGFLRLPAALSDDLSWIRSEFEEIFEASGIVHDGSQRSCIVPLIDASARLCGLLDHPAVACVVKGLLGEDANYLGSDGNYYTGDTGWHADGQHQVGTFLKIALYLDPVDAGSGALRVIPGSHRVESLEWSARDAYDAEQLWGVAGPDVPSVVLASQPGDAVVFNHNIMHSAWGGSTRRPMFTMNWSARATTEAEVAELRHYLGAHLAPHGDQPYGPLMLETADASRMRHLDQVLAHKSVMAEHRAAAS